MLAVGDPLVRQRPHDEVPHEGAEAEGDANAPLLQRQGRRVEGVAAELDNDDLHADCVDDDLAL